MAEPDSKSDQPGLADPPASLWTELGMVPEAAVRGGFQSKVFLARGQPGRLIVKLIEAGPADAELRHRVEVTRQLAEINPAVVGPLALGTEPDTGLPLVTALNGVAESLLERGQLIHGDYAAANLIVTPSGLKIIDFDECGQGTVEFEIANMLYMALFDAWNSDTLDRHDRFRSWFVDGYRNAAARDVDDAILDGAIRVRATALKRWLARPAEAPVGIRTSSADWRERLQLFVAVLRG